jgi:hypothetical protein
MHRLRQSEFVKEMGRTKPRTVSELMDIANKFADGEYTYHNKRARSPEDDMPHRSYSQRRRSRNYDNHNQIAPGFKEKARKRRSIETSGTSVKTNRVAANSFGPETPTHHLKKS